MNDVDALSEAARKAVLLQITRQIVHFRACEDACLRAGMQERAAGFRYLTEALRRAHMAEMFDPEPRP
jgi:hypothetical protein